MKRCGFSCVVCFVLMALVLWGTSGCSTGVQEDRHVNYSADGSSVAFQHGNDGVYTADAETGALQQIHDGQGALAVGSPLWAPDRQSLIYTIALPAPDQPDATSVPSAWDAAPEGRRFFTGITKYHCYIRPADASKPGLTSIEKHSESSDRTTGTLGIRAAHIPAPESATTSAGVTPPKESPLLFTAQCDHLGYIAGNLAVSWHPDGKQIHFVDQTAEDTVQLFVYDLASKRSHPAGPCKARALVHGWSPDGSVQYCLAACQDETRTGLWLRRVDAQRWEHVTGSTAMLFPQAENGVHVDMLERLRRAKPSFDAQGRLAATVWFQPHEDQSWTSSIRLIDISNGAIGQQVFGGDHTRRIRDLKWHPDGVYFGFISGDGIGTLQVQRATSEQATDEQSIGEIGDARSFIGWSFDGELLAYTTLDDVGQPAKGDVDWREWALLFPRQTGARDRLVLKNWASDASQRMALDRMRLTFAQWAPSKQELSLWCTFTPTHVSLLNANSALSLRAGDPAATLDVVSNILTWLPINARESAQVGHYYMLHRDFKTAWSWYQQARSRRLQEQAATTENGGGVSRNASPDSDAMFFEYVCLSQLGRVDEAEKLLGQWRKGLQFGSLEQLWSQPDIDQAPNEKTDEVGRSATADGTVTAEAAHLETLNCFAHAAHAVEVYASLGMTREGKTYFRDQLEHSRSADEKLAAAICLGQMHLLNQAPEQYVTSLVDDLLPKLSGMKGLDVPREGTGEAAMVEAMRISAIQIALLPMLSQEFLKAMPIDVREQSLAQLDNQLALPATEMAAHYVALMRRALLASLDRQPDGVLGCPAVIHTLFAGTMDASSQHQLDEGVSKIIKLLRGLTLFTSN